MTALTESINQIVNLSEDEITAIEKAYNTIEISKGALFIEQGKICDQGKVDQTIMKYSFYTINF